MLEKYYKNCLNIIVADYVDNFWSLDISVKTTGKIAHFTHVDLFASNFWTHMIGFTNVLLLWLEKFSCTCMCTMGDAQLQARKTRAFFQPELSFKCCLFFLISSNRHGSRFHKLYEQEKKIRKIHNFLVKNQISKPLLTLDISLLNNHSKMKINQSFNLVFN